MGILDDTAVFAAIIQQGGFSHAAKYLGISNGLVSRRLAQLETDLGATLIKRTTRQWQLTPEGELFWQHAQRIQQELDTAVSLIQSSAKKPKGLIRVSAPPYFGRHFLTPILTKFLNDFGDIQIDLLLSQQRLDPVKESLDLTIRGAGYLEESGLQDSSLQMKLLLSEKIGLYAHPHYLLAHGEPKTPEDLSQHHIIHYAESKRVPEHIKWQYINNKARGAMTLLSKFNVNDIESALAACTNSYGIGKFTELNVKQALLQRQLRPVLTTYDWGSYHLYAIYPHQHALPKRTRLLLEFIKAHTQYLLQKG